MARQLRLEFPGACYHVINRGNYRRSLFAEDTTREAFERTLIEAAQRFGWRVHAFVIMRNHFHLAVETPDPNLGDGMRWLQGTWAVRFNRFRSEQGHLFQGRYRAQHVQLGHSLAQVAHYIHLNPVRAGIVDVHQLSDFRWSSLHHFPKPDRPAWLDASIVLRESGALPDSAEGWQGYLDYLAELVGESAEKKKERFGQIKRGWCVGSKEFKQGLLADLKDRGVRLDMGKLSGVESENWQEVREEEWRQRLGQGADGLKLDLKALPLRKSASEKVLLAAWMRQTTGVSNGWLATELNMGKPATVSQFVRRFKLNGGTESAPFRHLLSIVKP